MEQVEHTINIFEAKTNGLAQGLFMFDNAPGHMKHALDAITARGMVKGTSLEYIFFACLDSVPSQLPNVAGRLYRMGHACVVTATTWHQLGRLVECARKGDVLAQGTGLA